ncbi:MAG: trigger factor [Gemmatimonadota bacterium]
MTSDTTTDLGVSVETPSAWNRKLTITVPAPRVHTARERVLALIAGRVRRPGFRKGHVPRKIVERDFGREIEQETLQRLVEESFREAVVKEGLEPITEGAVQVVRYSPEPGADLVFEARFDIRPDIRLDRLGGFRVKAQAVSVSEEEVSEALERLREAHAVWRPVERAPVTGDRVATAVTPAEGEATAPQRSEFRIGEGEVVADAESAVLTLAPGQEGEFTVRYPADFPDEARRGSSQRLRIRVESVWERELPALDDSFAADAAGAESVDALRQRLADGLRREKEAEEARRVQNELLDRILEANPLEVPESMVERFLDTILQPAQDAPPEAVARAREEYRPAAVRGIQRTLVIQSVAERSGLRASAEEVTARVESLAKRVGRPAPEVRRHLERSGELQELTRRITEEKVFEHLESLSTIE